MPKWPGKWIGKRREDKAGEGDGMGSDGRGEVMEEASLVTALQTGQIRGAALDVAPREPLPADSPLWSMSNVVMTPHTAGASQFRQERNMERFIRNLQRFLADEPLVGVIDKHLGY